jgi:hypothetical protein
MSIRGMAIVGGIFAGIVVLAFILAATFFGWWPTIVNMVLPAILDIVLIIAALTSGVMLFALLRAVVNLTRTVREIRGEVLPVLDSLRATTNTVRETARTASNLTIAPTVRTASFVVGAGEIASVMLGRGRARKRAQDRQKRRAQIEREMAAREDLDGNL